jgi:uncharacterized membrane protein
MNLKTLVQNALIAALYVILVLVLYFMSFDAIQFRVAEVLLVLLLFNKKYIYGIVLGTMIANFIGPFGSIDALIGGLASLLSCLALIYVKNKYISLLFPSIINGFIVGFEIYYIFDLKEIPFMLNVLYVFIGEFVVSYILGLIVYYILNKNERIKEYLTDTTYHT